MKRIWVFSSPWILGLSLALGATAASAQSEGRHITFNSYMIENQKILARRKATKNQVAFQDASPRSVASEPAAVSLPSANGPNPAYDPHNNQMNPGSNPGVPVLPVMGEGHHAQQGMLQSPPANSPIGGAPPMAPPAAGPPETPPGASAPPPAGGSAN